MEGVKEIIDLPSYGEDLIGGEFILKKESIEEF